MAELKDTKVITGLVRLSYAHIWEAAAIEGSDDKKFGAALLIPKTEKKTIALIKAAVEAAKENGKNSKFKGKIPANLKLPLRDGDAERPDDGVYAGHYFVNANAKTRPGVVDKNRQPILQQDEVYSGCYVYASITFFPFDSNGNKGIACGLNHVMKVKDGEPLDGRSSAESDFEGIEIGDDDDLLG